MWYQWDVPWTYPFQSKLVWWVPLIWHCFCRDRLWTQWDGRSDNRLSSALVFLQGWWQSIFVCSHPLAHSRQWTRPRYRHVGGPARIWRQWMLHSSYHKSRLYCSCCTSPPCVWLILFAQRSSFLWFSWHVSCTFCKSLHWPPQPRIFKIDIYKLHCKLWTCWTCNTCYLFPSCWQ